MLIGIISVYNSQQFANVPIFTCFLSSAHRPLSTGRADFAATQSHRPNF